MSESRFSFVIALVSVAALGALAGCSKKDDAAEATPLAARATTLETSKAASAKTTTFTIDAMSKTTIDMPAPKEHIKAKTTAAAGSIEVDLANLANTRGEVKVDLTTLSTFTFGDKSKDEAQTEHARTWLEAVVDDKVKEENRYTVFAIRSIDGVDQPDASKIAPKREGDEDIRTAMLTAHGDFLLHGRKSMKDAKLVARLHYPAGAPADAIPTSIEIKTAAPLRIVLAEHEVKPRDTFGKVAQGSFHLLGTKVAESADVSIDLHAMKSPTKS